MAITDRFKLEKLTINVYGKQLRIGVPEKKFKVMYNPESFSMQHVNVYQKLQGINTSGRRARYSHSRAKELDLELIFDGTGVGDFGASTLLGLGARPVSKQVGDFLDLCFHMDGNLHEPKFLKIQWGQGELKAFDCRLESVNVTYTSFDRSGAPLRAKLAAKFVEDLEPSKRLKLENKHSPDLTQSRVVKAGDTLPLLCKEVYGDAGYYLLVARANQLDDFRNLTPGQSLLFPPLADRPATTP
jgi:hypothetical protein